MKNRNSLGRFAGGILLANVLAVAAGASLSALFGAIFDGALRWISTILTVVLFFFFIYHEGWIRGGADKNFVQDGRSAWVWWKGAAAGALAAIPSCVLAVLSLLVSAGLLHTVTWMEQDVAVMLYRVWDVPFQFLFGALDALPALYFLPAVFMIAVATLGYFLGGRQIRLSDYFYYARERDE